MSAINRPYDQRFGYRWIAETFPKDNNTYVWLITRDKRMYRSDELTLLAIGRLIGLMAGGKVVV